MYKYYTVFNYAHNFDYFEIDASKFEKGLHIGLSHYPDYGVKWEFVLGGWTGTKSVLRLRNSIKM